MSTEIKEETYALLCYSRTLQEWRLEGKDFSDEGTAMYHALRYIGPNLPYLITEDWRAQCLLKVLNATKGEPVALILHNGEINTMNVDAKAPPPAEPVGVQTDPSYWR